MRFIYQFMGFVLRSSYELVNSILPDSRMISNYAIAIVIMSILIKLITLPLTLKQQKSMAKSRALQPRLKELQEKYGNDAQTIARKQQELYKEAGVNPLGGCLPLLIQFPILIAMWRVVQEPTTYVFTEPGFYDSINKSFLWIENLNNVDTTMILPILAAVLSFLNTKLMTKMQATPSTGDKERDEAMKKSNDMMQLMMPLMFIFIYRSLPAVLPLYMIISMGLSTIQQLFINRMFQAEGENKWVL